MGRGSKSFHVSFGAGITDGALATELRFKFDFDEAVKDFLKKHFKDTGHRTSWDGGSKQWIAKVPGAHAMRMIFWQAACDVMVYAQIAGFQLNLEDAVTGDLQRTLGVTTVEAMSAAGKRVSALASAGKIDVNADATKQWEASLDGLEETRRGDAPPAYGDALSRAFGIPPGINNPLSREMAEAAAAADPVARFHVPRDGYTLKSRLLFKHQVEGLQFFAARGRAIIAHEQGLGKTTTATAASELAKAGRVVVVCPEHARVVWQEEFTFLTGRPVFVFGIDDKPGANWMATDNGVLVIGYASVIRQSVIERLGLAPLDFDLLIVDESHYLSDHQSQRTEAVDTVSQRVRMVMLLSGTPIPGGQPRQLFPQLRIIDRNKFANYSKYSARFCGAHKGKFGWVDDGATNVPELYDLLHKGGIMHRKRKSECLDLPSKFHVSMPLPVDPKALKEAWQLFLNANPTGPGAANNLRKFTADFMYEPMRDWLIDWLRNNPGERIIVFAYHKEFIERFNADPVLKDQLVLHHGDMGSTERKLSLDMWRMKDTGQRVLMATIPSLGTGVTLTEANHMAFFEYDWSPGNMLQAEDRIHRIGQKESCTYYYFWAKSTIYKRILGTLHKKMQVAHKLLEGNTLTPEEHRINTPDMFNDIIEMIESTRPKQDQNIQPFDKAPAKGTLSPDQALISAAVLAATNSIVPQARLIIHNAVQEYKAGKISEQHLRRLCDLPPY